MKTGSGNLLSILTRQLLALGDSIQKCINLTTPFKLSAFSPQVASYTCLTVMDNLDKENLAKAGVSSEQIEHAAMHEPVSYTVEEEKALVRKIDLTLLPTIWFMYLLSYMDRTKLVTINKSGGEWPLTSVSVLEMRKSLGWMPIWL